MLKWQPWQRNMGSQLNHNLIEWLSNPLVQISFKHCQSQTRRARELKFLENAHTTVCVTCHMSRVMCHMSNVMCHLSCVTCHMFLKKCRKKIPSKKIGQRGGASWWKVCYQRGLYKQTMHQTKYLVPLLLTFNNQESLFIYLKTLAISAPLYCH